LGKFFLFANFTCYLLVLIVAGLVPAPSQPGTVTNAYPPTAGFADEVWDGTVCDRVDHATPGRLTSSTTDRMFSPRG